MTQGCNRLLIFLFALTLCGCSSLQYAFQAGRGQMEIFNRARPIPEVLLDPKTSPRTKELLGSIENVKRFGEAHGISPTPNFTSYVDLKRSAAVWVVSACEPLKFQSKHWSFPIIGSFPYLGWFNPSDAERYASDLEKEGWEVDVRPADAYSTLGWFKDPILSTMISEGPNEFAQLVNVVLHESVHASHFVKDQSYFNESLAEFVAGRLTIEYLDQIFGPHSDQKKSYVQSVEEQKKRMSLFCRAYWDLNSVYLSSKPVEEKLQAKQAIMTHLNQAARVKRKINNATLVQYKTYHTGKKGFEELFKCSHSDWALFMTHLRSITPEVFSRPNQSNLSIVFTPLIHEVCPEDLH